ncbi:Hypothetical protein SRAE_0000060950 [Strongyloides ratti]|uniref:Uncharacterized protein n=1 Tax=Strongyloides ratti TaxID=34506 RepID=A0A090KVN7_STRRB|nr:Hypothetical protein SRAE_0000060950 [Strongyloides ratti]CEF61486.1 Hypothetical protein SRAE_0000060950 [Strongyloides ratti]
MKHKFVSRNETEDEILQQFYKIKKDFVDFEDEQRKKRIFEVSQIFTERSEAVRTEKTNEPSKTSSRQIIDILFDIPTIIPDLESEKAQYLTLSSFLVINRIIQQDIIKRKKTNPQEEEQDDTTEKNLETLRNRP